MESTTLGCPACLDLAMREQQPELVTTTSPGGFLYRCDCCQTWWTGNSRFRSPAPVDEAEAHSPGQVVAASPVVDDAQLRTAVVLFTGWGCCPNRVTIWTA